jgi:flagellar motor switch protein FliN
MSTTVQVERAVADALDAAAAKFPIADLERQPAEVVDAIDAKLPDGGGRWVAASFEDDRPGTVSVVVSFDVASGLFNSSGKAPKLVAVLTAAATSLGVKLGDPVMGRAPVDRPAAPDGTTTVTAVALVSAGEHVVTIYVEQADPESPADAAAFPQLDATTAAASPVATAAIGGAIGGSLATADARALSVIRSVEMNVTAELGRSTMTVRQLLELSPGSVIELDRAAGSPVDLLVNGTIIARGEVVVIDEEYGIRVSEIIGSPEDL